LYVDEEVLIPRPETEELVEWIIAEYADGAGALKILDIGTGSGCIPLALKRKWAAADVHAIDVSDGALRVAQKNASSQNLDVHYHAFDILSAGEFPLGSFDVIVSNPPYIPLRDKDQMRDNVLMFEPWLALFVENDDPLCFYKAIAGFGRRYLKQEGSLFFEIHEEAGQSVTDLLKSTGYHSIQLRKDMQGKDRMIRAII
jgi:release factor glutamine methyltransferase